MKSYILIISLLTGTSLFAQDETILIESSANVVFSGDIKLVLDNISLTNEGSLDVSSGEILVSSSTSSFLSTNQSLSLNSLVTGDNNVSFGGEGAFEVSSLTIGSSDNIIFSDTSSLKLTGTVNATGEITMESGSALWIERTITETALDNVTIERIGPHNSSTGKYSVYGSPVQNSPFTVFGTKAEDWIYQYNESTYDFSSPSESNMTRSKGYFVAFPGDADGKVTFNGTPYYQNRNYSVDRTEVGDDSKEGFNLVANLFTCPIDFETFIGAQTILDESTIWLWDDYSSDAGGGTSADYLTVNTLGVTDSRNMGDSKWDGTINVAQGFLVKAASSGSVSFNESMKTLDGNDDASFFRTGSIPRYWFTLESEALNKSSTTLIGYVLDATYEKDERYDASKFGSGFSIYSLIDDYRLAIQGLPTTWLEDYDKRYSIPLGYNAEEAGDYNIMLSHMEDDELEALYLNDHLNLRSINILVETYDFSTVAGSINDRFSISLEPLGWEEILSINDFARNILVYGNSNAIILDAAFEGNIQVLTLEGRLLYQNSFESGKTEIPVLSGLYIVSVESQEGMSSYKVKVSN